MWQVSVEMSGLGRQCGWSIPMLFSIKKTTLALAMLGEASPSPPLTAVRRDWAALRTKLTKKKYRREMGNYARRDLLTSGHPSRNNIWTFLRYQTWTPLADALGLRANKRYIVYNSIQTTEWILSPHELQNSCMYGEDSLAQFQSFSRHIQLH